MYVMFARTGPDEEQRGGRDAEEGPEEEHGERDADVRGSDVDEEVGDQGSDSHEEHVVEEVRPLRLDLPTPRRQPLFLVLPHEVLADEARQPVGAAGAQGRAHTLCVYITVTNPNIMFSMYVMYERTTRNSAVHVSKSELGTGNEARW